MTKLSQVFLIALAAALAGCGRNDLPAPNLAPVAGAQPSAGPLETPVDAKLFELWKKENSEGDAAYLADLNEKTLRSLETNVPVAGGKPFGPHEAAVAHLALNTNLVTMNRTKYEQPGTAIGYCFGRAMFVHLYALKNHYRKAQIRKIWAVGDMKTEHYHWAFHVATMVQDGATGEWRVIDSLMKSAVSPRHWTQMFLEQNAEKRDLRFYVTSAEKFTPNMGKYTRGQLGLDLSLGKDWYKHYFVDLMATLKIREQIDKNGEDL